MANPAPGFRDHPNHGIALGLPVGHVAVRVKGTDIAHTRRAVRLDEQGYPMRYYVPMEDVAQGVLQRTDKTTHCPFKGDTTYYDVTVDGTRIANAAWSYERPFDEMEKIAGHVAFDGEDIEVLAFEV